MLLPQSRTWITMPLRLHRIMGVRGHLQKRLKKIIVDFNNMINNNSTH